MEWLLLVSLLVLVITKAYVLQMKSIDYGFLSERYVNYARSSQDQDLAASIAPFGQGLPLADMLTVSTGLSGLTAEGCAAGDATRQMELGGQYVQRTNNFRREYPDNCSSLQSDFVGGFYKPKKEGVPCDGDC